MTDMTDEELRAAQVALEFAAHLLYDEPTDADVASYLEPGLFAAAPFGKDDDAVRTGLAAMNLWRDSIAHKVADNDDALHECATDLRSDWLNLLVGMGEPKAPTWAGYYLNPSSAILGESALAVRRLYRQHGFQVRHLNQEPDDHLGLMLSFIVLLIQLELDDADDPAFSVSESAAEACQVQLLRDYILPWLPLWRWSVEKFARTAFYRGVGDLVFGLVRAYAVRFGFCYVDDDENPHFVKG